MALKENDHAVCLAINTAGKIAVVSKLGQVFAAELDITEEGTCLTLSNRVEFSALIMTKELEVVRSTQMFSKYHAVTCAQWGGKHYS